MEKKSKTLRNIKLTLEYDGTLFAGWQVQPGQRTIQGEVEAALKKITREEIRITGSGRTDAGVHALGQIANFKTEKPLPLSAYREGLNTVLPREIRILRAEEMHVGFDARRDAIRRTYCYVIAKAERAIGYQYAWFPNCQFQIGPMRKASKYLKGEHAFSAFCKDNGEGGDCVSRVFRVHWDETPSEIRFEISAIRFFHNMIRIIMGTLMEVGRGKITPGQFRTILEQRDRASAGPTVPPHGLFLVDVMYP
jgi:tRNA pseudouridine38-40 synthase